MIVAFGMPLAIIALPNASVSSVAPSQFRRSAIASKGEAEACTPLSPTLGSDLRPSAFHVLKISLRSAPSVASLGSVAPSTLPRKSSQDSLAGSHSTR